MKLPTIPRPFAALLLSIALAACDGKSSPTKENFAKAVQTYFDSKEAVCIFTGAVPFDAAHYSYEERSAEPLVKLGLLTKEPTSVQDDGSAHRMVPGFHFALTDEGKKSYHPANPAKESKICGCKAKLLAIAQATSASDKPNVGDRVLVRFEAKLVDRPRWDDEAVLRPVHVEVLSTENDQYHGEYFLELTSGGWVVNPSLLQQLTQHQRALRLGTGDEEKCGQQAQGGSGARQSTSRAQVAAARRDNGTQSVVFPAADYRAWYRRDGRNVAPANDACENPSRGFS